MIRRLPDLNVSRKMEKQHKPRFFTFSLFFIIAWLSAGCDKPIANEKQTKSTAEGHEYAGKLSPSQQKHLVTRSLKLAFSNLGDLRIRYGDGSDILCVFHRFPHDDFPEQHEGHALIRMSNEELAGQRHDDEVQWCIQIRYSEREDRVLVGLDTDGVIFKSEDQQLISAHGEGLGVEFQWVGEELDEGAVVHQWIE